MPFTIIIITFNRINDLKECLISLDKSLGKENIELIVVINGEENQTKNMLLNYFPKIKMIESKSRLTPAAARNLGIKKSSGKYIGFIDDDTIFPSDYFSKLKVNLKYGADVFGGPDKTPQNSTFFQKSLGLTLKSPLATSKTRFRHKDSKIKEPHKGSEKNLILCHLWFKKDIFSNDSFLFNENYFRNEENILLNKLDKAKKNILYFPNFYIYHKRKGDFLGLIKATHSSGFYRIKSIYEDNDSFSIFYIIPAFFLLFLLLSPIIPYSKQILIFYFLITFVTSLYLCIKSKKIFHLFQVSLIQILINLSYGAGVLNGLLFSKNFLSSQIQVE